MTTGHGTTDHCYENVPYIRSSQSTSKYNFVCVIDKQPYNWALFSSFTIQTQDTAYFHFCIRTNFFDLRNMKLSNAIEIFSTQQQYLYFFAHHKLNCHSLPHTQQRHNLSYDNMMIERMKTRYEWSHNLKPVQTFEDTVLFDEDNATFLSTTSICHTPAQLKSSRDGGWKSRFTFNISSRVHLESIFLDWQIVISIVTLDCKTPLVWIICSHQKASRSKAILNRTCTIAVNAIVLQELMLNQHDLHLMETTMHLRLF